MPSRQIPQLEWNRPLFRAGERVAVAVSGGADSVALLCALAGTRQESGLVLSVVHVHHGLRGDAADQDAAFVGDLAAQLGLAIHLERGDVKALAAERRQGIEEAARELRSRVFRDLLRSQSVDAVATAHTLDDQAETVLIKLLRGAWTEGLGGIAPVVTVDGGRIVRPLLGVTRQQIVAALEAAGQGWREDATNQDQAFTRNRVRHTLLPLLRDFQPQIAAQLARLAQVARDEEAWWERELARQQPGLVLPGKPVRGGGRANPTQPGEASVAIELERLRALHPALQRRMLRAAAAEAGAEMGFERTEALRTLALDTERGAGRRARVELGDGVAAERSLRELRIARSAATATVPEPRVVPVPGTLDAEEFGLRIVAGGALPGEDELVLRTPRPGDRLRLCHSQSDKTVKDVLERQGLGAAERARRPVLALGSHIVWMDGVEVECAPGLALDVRSL